jgi:membrane associated rhomboid family serine protease
MIPVSDVIPARTQPFVTVAAILLTSIVFGYALATGPPPAAPALDCGSPMAADFALPTLVHSMFGYGGWAPFLGSMLYLWIFGRTVEDRLGHGRFLALYLLCGGTAIAAHALVSPEPEMRLVGGAGAVAGVLGGYFSLYPQSRVLTLVPLPPGIVEVPALVFLGLWVLAQVVTSLEAAGETGGLPFSARSPVWPHAAGLATGAVACALLRRPERLRVEWWGP